MAVDPVIQVRRDGDPVAIDVVAMSGLDPALVAGGLGFLLGGEAACPSGLADTGLGGL